MMPKANPRSVRDAALASLARREHTRQELAHKLAQAGFAVEDVTTLLDELESGNWLSDRRFAESYVADHLARYGSVKLAYELRLRGISAATIDDVLRSSEDSELERAQEIWRKKFGTPPQDPLEKAKQMRFLQGRGFSSDLASRIVAATISEGPATLPKRENG